MVAVSLRDAERGGAAVDRRVSNATSNFADLVPGAVGELPGCTLIAVGDEAHAVASAQQQRSRVARIPATFHVDPPLSEYCQVPLPLSTPVMATPCSAPESASVIEAPTMEAMVCPPLVVSSSVIGTSSGATGVSPGASLTATTLMSTVLLTTPAEPVPLLPWSSVVICTLAARRSPPWG